MNCREVLAKLYDYLDQEVKSTEKQQLDKHLEICTDCLRKYKLEEDFLKFISEKGRQPHDASALKEKVKREIEKMDAASHPRNISFLLVPLVIAAAVAFVMFFPAGGKNDKLAVFNAVRPFAEEHTKCLDGSVKSDVQSNDPTVVKAAISKLTSLPDDLFRQTPQEVSIAGATISHLSVGDEPHVDFHAFGDDISVFVVAPNAIDKRPFRMIEHDGESYYIGSCPRYQYVIWECEGYECVAVSKLSQESLDTFAFLF